MSEHPHGGWEPMPGQQPPAQPYQQPPLPVQQPYAGAPAPQQYGQAYYPPYVHQGGPQPMPPRQPAGSNGRGPVLVAVGVFALIAVLAVVLALVNRRTDDGSTTALPAPTTAAPPSVSSPSSEREPVSPSRPPAPEPGSRELPTPVGQPAQVGDYQVTVTSVILDGDDIVAGANQFNDPPTGRYVIVEATAQYVGATEGNAFWDLSYVLNGTDARQYTDTDCSAVLPNDAIDSPTLNPGGSASFQVCMDVPPAAIDGAVLFIEPLVSFDDRERVWFAVR